MEQIAKLHIEKLPEGVYFATSEDIPGLVAQGRTVAETIEIARDVARKLIEARTERQGTVKLATIEDSFDYPRIVRNHEDCSYKVETKMPSSVSSGLT